MSPEKPAPETPSQTTPVAKIEGVAAVSVVTAIATTGKREAFRNLVRQLSSDELSNSGVQKLLLEDLEKAESECETLQGYVERFHDADKRAAVLDERLHKQTAFDILFGVGVGLGGAIIGVSPVFWDTTSKGPIALVIGILLVAGSTAARIVKR